MNYMAHLKESIFGNLFYKSLRVTLLEQAKNRIEKKMRMKQCRPCDKLC